MRREIIGLYVSPSSSVSAGITRGATFRPFTVSAAMRLSITRRQISFSERISRS